MLATRQDIPEESLEQYFPVEFENGHRVESLVFWCVSCSKPLPVSLVHGQISRLIKEVVDITASAACPCGNVNHYRIRLHDNGTFSYLDHGEWVQKSIAGHPGFLAAIRKSYYLVKLRIYVFMLDRALKKLRKALARTRRTSH